MKNRKFNFSSILENAKEGLYTKAELKKFMKAADEFGKPFVARELSLYLIPVTYFAGDSAPDAIKERVSKGMSYLNAQGHTLSRTKQMIKRHGIIETINRLGAKAGISHNLEMLSTGGMIQYSAESIVVDYPELFAEKIVRISTNKLAELNDPTLRKVKSILKGLVESCSFDAATYS